MDAYSIYPKQFNNTKSKMQTDTCFVIMPFSEELDNTYMVIESVAVSMGINCSRADKISTTSEPILNKICTQISQAYYIIADITNLNPNVFYELGIAHVLRDAKKVLIIKEEQTECPSDIKHLHYYAYSKLTLKHLKDTVIKFFTENNILEDLQSVLDFWGLTPEDKVLTHNFVVSLSCDIGCHMSSLIAILNNRAKELTVTQVNDLLVALTWALNKFEASHELHALYSRLTLIIIQKTCNVFDISNYLSKIFIDDQQRLERDWLADCSISVLDNPLYFDIACSWIIQHLKRTSPAEFDIPKYRIEIGLIKSKTSSIDAVLVKELQSANKTLAEHCAKLIKERKTYAAIPVLLELLKDEKNPYVVRSCLDALVKIAPLEKLLCAKEILSNRESFVEINAFIKKHLIDLNQQILYLQNASKR